MMMVRAENNNVVYRLLWMLCAFYCLSRTARESAAEEVTGNEYDQCVKVDFQKNVTMNLVRDDQRQSHKNKIYCFKNYEGEGCR